LPPLLTGVNQDADLDGLKEQAGVTRYHSLRRSGATRTGGHGEPGCQVQMYSQDSQRKSQPLRARLKSSRNAPHRGHCAIKVDAR
jgi:hypothetical protein